MPSYQLGARLTPRFRMATLRQDVGQIRTQELDTTRLASELAEQQVTPIQHAQKRDCPVPATPPPSPAD